MSISLKFMNKPQYLVVKLIGKWTTADALTSIEDIKIEAEKQKIKHILLDLQDLSFPDNEMTRFFSGEKIANTFGSFYSIAGFSQSEKINRFAEIVSRNRGANFKMFDSEADATNWLQGQMNDKFNKY